MKMAGADWRVRLCVYVCVRARGGEGTHERPYGLSPLYRGYRRVEPEGPRRLPTAARERDYDRREYPNENTLDAPTPRYTAFFQINIYNFNDQNILNIKIEIIKISK